MNINKKEAEIILELAQGWMIGEGQGTNDSSDCELVLKIFQEYPEFRKTSYGYMEKQMMEWAIIYSKKKKKIEKLEKELKELKGEI